MLESKVFQSRKNSSFKPPISIGLTILPYLNYLCIDRSKKRDQGRCYICSASTNTYIEWTPEMKAFKNVKGCVQLKTEKS